jgi:adenylosuccinate synthase
VIDTERNTPEDVFVRVSSHLGLYGRGEYGSEGKGHIASYLARE